jgi:hypothetical protein
LIVDHRQVIAAIHRHRWVVRVDAGRTVQEVLHLGERGESIDVHLKDAGGCHGAGAPVVTDTHGRPQRAVPPHRVDHTRPTRLDTYVRAELGGVGRGQARAADRKIDTQQLRVGERLIGDAPDGQSTFGWKAVVDHIARWIGSQALGGLEVESAHAAGAQVGEVEETGRFAGEQRGLAYDANLGALEEEGPGLEHVGREVDGVVVDSDRRQVREVVGWHHVVGSRIEGIEGPGIAWIVTAGDGQQEECGERVAAA